MKTIRLDPSASMLTGWGVRAREAFPVGRFEAFRSLVYDAIPVMDPDDADLEAFLAWAEDQARAVGTSKAPIRVEHSAAAEPATVQYSIQISVEPAVRDAIIRHAANLQVSVAAYVASLVMDDLGVQRKPLPGERLNEARKAFRAWTIEHNIATRGARKSLAEHAATFLDVGCPVTPCSGCAWCQASAILDLFEGREFGETKASREKA